MCHAIVEGNLRGKISWIIVVAEGAGSAQEIAKEITDMTSLETRAVVLGHVQRGGRPTAFSRELALNLGRSAVDCLLAGKTDEAVGMKDGKIISVDFGVAITKKDLHVEGVYNLIRILT
jgi:6-phosphofructokinase 1